MKLAMSKKRTSRGQGYYSVNTAEAVKGQLGVIREIGKIVRMGDKPRKPETSNPKKRNE